MLKLKKGDEVIIISGKDRGKKGKIEKVIVKDQRVLLPGLNIYKKHVKKRDEQHPGGVVELPRPLPLSKVAFICPKCGKPTRLGFEIKGKEKRRICKKCESLV